MPAKAPKGKKPTKKAVKFANMAFIQPRPKLQRVLFSCYLICNGSLQCLYLTGVFYLSNDTHLWNIITMA
jgi:hypothetical protein